MVSEKTAAVIIWVIVVVLFVGIGRLGVLLTHGVNEL